MSWGHDSLEVLLRTDDPTAYNPFGWRHAEIADPLTEPHRRRVLAEELLVAEAEEAAAGRRHVTVVHGDPDTLATSLHLTAFYEGLAAVASTASWSRVRGTDRYVTVTVGGEGADAVACDLLVFARRANPGHWAVTASACPAGW